MGFSVCLTIKGEIEVKDFIKILLQYNKFDDNYKQYHELTDLLSKRLDNKFNDNFKFNIKDDGKLEFHDDYPDVLFKIVSEWIDEDQLKQSNKLERCKQTYSDLYYELDEEEFTDILDAFYINQILQYFNDQEISNELISKHFICSTGGFGYEMLNCEDEIIKIPIGHYSNYKCRDDISIDYHQLSNIITKYESLFGDSINIKTILSMH